MMNLDNQSQESLGIFRETPKVKKLLFVETYSRNKVSVQFLCKVSVSAVH